jgi:hypothetical protein
MSRAGEARKRGFFCHPEPQARDLFCFCCRNEQQVPRSQIGMTADVIFSKPEE